MLFNSYEFLIFLPCVLLLYRLSARCLSLQNVLLVLASYVFYAWWDVRFLSLILGMTALGFAGGCLLEVTRRQPRLERAVCIATVVLCVGVLGWFKYYGFFADNFARLLHTLGFRSDLPTLRIVLPVGISFYTFQILSYVVDVYRRKIPACRDAVAFAAFVCFFPQLVAGPIEKAQHLLPQMQAPRSVGYAQFVDGLRLVLWGFVKKMLLADRVAPVVQAIYANPQSDGTDLMMGTLLFAFQIYGDFSGYSDIAVGTARLFGIRLSRNFALPYFATDIPTFWRRWHTSLMEWFREYVYFPLGGSRCSRLRQLRNTFVVFTLSGLWHGAAWTFVAWGVFHACCFVPHILSRNSRGAHGAAVVHRQQHVTASIGRLVRMLCTYLKSAISRQGKAKQVLLYSFGLTKSFSLVCIGWVFFRSESLTAAFCHLGRMVTDLHFHTPYGGLSTLYPVVFVVGVEWLTRHRAHALDLPQIGPLRYRCVRWTIYYALLFATFYWGGTQSAFIYFQF